MGSLLPIAPRLPGGSFFCFNPANFFSFYGKILF